MIIESTTRTNKKKFILLDQIEPPKKLNKKNSPKRIIKKKKSASGSDRRSIPMSPTTPSNTGSLKIGRPRSRSKSPFRSFRWKRGSSSRAADSDDEAGKIKLIYFSFKSILSNFCRQHQFYFVYFLDHIFIVAFILELFLFVLCMIDIVNIIFL